MTKNNCQLPVELKHILSTIGIADGSALTVEQKLKDRAAIQVQDYIEVMCHKIRQFQGAEVDTDVHDTIDLLQKHTSLRLP
jgi:hypothetical protein